MEQFRTYRTGWSGKLVQISLCMYRSKMGFQLHSGCNVSKRHPKTQSQMHIGKKNNFYYQKLVLVSIIVILTIKCRFVSLPTAITTTRQTLIPCCLFISFYHCVCDNISKFIRTSRLQGTCNLAWVTTA